MLATALSSSLVGLQSNLVRVEADVARGVPSFELVGMAEASVRESRVRVKSALLQVGVDTCESRIVINLAPADMRKTGCHLDLAVAVATLAALGIVPRGPLEGMLFLGELSLSGAIGPVRGVLPQIVGARKHGLRSAVVPKDNGPEAALVDGVRTYTAATLSELVQALSGEQELSLAERCAEPRGAPRQPYDLSEVRGQLQARRALEIAAAGGHNMLLVGPPGSGKTMLARRLPGLLPPMSTDEALDVTSIQSVAGLAPARRGMAEERPFRAPHHTVSDVGLVGGGDGCAAWRG
jgi:magnesium chelatase family protein